MNSAESSSDRVISIGPKKKIALVCSGGAAKAGAFHLGVALALKEQGFSFFGGLNPRNGEKRVPGPMEISTYVGSSAGSIISAYLAAGFSLDMIFNSFLGIKADDSLGLDRILPRLTYPKMFRFRPELNFNPMTHLSKLKQLYSDITEKNWDALVSFNWLKLTGLFSSGGIEEYLREEVLPSNQFCDYASELYIVATQLNHSRKVVFGKYSYQPPPFDLSCQYDNGVGISDACAASTALPVVFSPHLIRHSDGRTAHYIDGEIRDTLSTHVAGDSGADLIFASHTHQPFHLPESKGSLVDFGLPAIIIQSIYLLVEQKINNHSFNKNAHGEAIDAVSQYCKTEGISDRQRNDLCEILQEKLNYSPGVHTIYIHPESDDQAMFFGEHFSLSPKKMTEIVKSGFRATIQTLKRYEFADRIAKTAIGVV